jgi:phytoene desaturase
VVIGSGLGGLATAIRLQAAGHRVTVLEAQAGIGGRAGQIREAGFVFDLGPTIITAVHLLTSLWQSAGKQLPDYVDLIQMQPHYEIRFRDGISIAYGGQGNAEGMQEEVQRVRASDLPGYRRFMAKTRNLYERAFEQLARQPFLSAGDFLRVLPELVRSGAQTSVYNFASRYFQDEHLRVAFSFHPLFIGGNPFRASSIYSIVPYLEHTGGVWFARGGMHSLVKAMANLLVELGGEIFSGEPVVEIALRSGRAVGVRLDGGRQVEADVVVSNADVASTYLKLLPPSSRRHNTDKKLRRYKYSMSCFLVHLGLDQRYPHMRHHTVLMPADYQGAVQAIFSGHLLEDDLAAYIHIPTRTDPDMAPPGGETLYVLIPVPNLAGDIDWTVAENRIRDRAMGLLERELGMEDIEKHIVVERRFTPLDFQDSLRSYLGAGFSIEPTLFQSAYFRPHNRSEDVPNLYLVGAGTHPGAGLPGVLLSAEIAANLIASDGIHGGDQKATGWRARI